MYMYVIVTGSNTHLRKKKKTKKLVVRDSTVVEKKNALSRGSPSLYISSASLRKQGMRKYARGLLSLHD